MHPLFGSTKTSSSQCPNAVQDDNEMKKLLLSAHTKWIGWLTFSCHVFISAARRPIAFLNWDISEELWFLILGFSAFKWAHNCRCESDKKKNNNHSSSKYVLSIQASKSTSWPSRHPQEKLISSAVYFVSNAVQILFCKRQLMNQRHHKMQPFISGNGNEISSI